MNFHFTKHNTTVHQIDREGAAAKDGRLANGLKGTTVSSFRESEAFGPFQPHPWNSYASVVLSFRLRFRCRSEAGQLPATSKDEELLERIFNDDILWPYHGHFGVPR
jgi:hypothetical protein